MGRKRSHDRKQEQEQARSLRRHFLPVQADVPVTCDQCGRKFSITVPAVPKKGGAIHVARPCECGREISVTLTGRSSST